MTEKQARNIRLAEALESGEYKQGFGGDLRNSCDEYCCLGVACDLYDREGWGEHKRAYSHLDYQGFPHPDVVEFYGWESNNPKLQLLPLPRAKSSASILNDIQKATFPEIAQGFRLLAAEMDNA